MTLKRICLFCLAICLSSFVIVGCKSGDGETVDKPLMQNAPPPPPRPDKPSITPMGSGGGASPSATPGTSAP